MATAPTPTALDYVQRVRNCQWVFRDPELQNPGPLYGTGDQPRHQSGRFAICFQFGRPDGGWLAVRCFTYPQTQLAERYQALQAHFAQHPLDCLVRCEYLDPGIGMADGRQPILKMEWAEGTQLDTWLEERLKQRELDAIERLESRWLELIAELEAAEIAHGDLHPSNIMVTADGALRLVDYDGMYVPALAHLDSPCEGLPGFNHPARHAQFGPYLDRFPAWVILIGLRTLRLAPELAQEDLSRGLVLSADDLSEPEETAAWQRLRGLDDPELQGWLTTLAEACRQPLEDCPALPPPAPAVAEPDPVWLTRWQEAVAREDWPAVWVLLAHGDPPPDGLPAAALTPARVDRPDRLRTAWSAFRAAVNAKDPRSAMLLWPLVRDLPQAAGAAEPMEAKLTRQQRPRLDPPETILEAFRRAVRQKDKPLALMLWPRLRDRGNLARLAPLMSAWEAELAPAPQRN